MCPNKQKSSLPELSSCSVSINCKMNFRWCWNISKSVDDDFPLELCERRKYKNWNEHETSPTALSMSSFLSKRSVFLMILKEASRKLVVEEVSRMANCNEGPILRARARNRLWNWRSCSVSAATVFKAIDCKRQLSIAIRCAVLGVSEQMSWEVEKFENGKVEKVGTVDSDEP